MQGPRACETPAGPPGGRVTRRGGGGETRTRACVHTHRVCGVWRWVRGHAWGHERVPVERGVGVCVRGTGVRGTPVAVRTRVCVCVRAASWRGAVPSPACPGVPRGPPPHATGVHAVPRGSCHAVGTPMPRGPHTHTPWVTHGGAGTPGTPPSTPWVTHGGTGTPTPWRSPHPVGDPRDPQPPPGPPPLPALLPGPQQPGAAALRRRLVTVSRVGDPDIRGGPRRRVGGGLHGVEGGWRARVG